MSAEYGTHLVIQARGLNKCLITGMVQMPLVLLKGEARVLSMKICDFE